MDISFLCRPFSCLIVVPIPPYNSCDSLLCISNNHLALSPLLTTLGFKISTCRYILTSNQRCAWVTRFRKTPVQQQDISTKLSDDHEVTVYGWNWDHEESTPGEKLQASFGEIFLVLFFVSTYDSRYVKCITLSKFHSPFCIPKNFVHQLYRLLSLLLIWQQKIKHN